jgi:hypothetical protein
MSPKGGKKALKAAKTLRTSPVVEPQHLPTRSPLDDGSRSQMFNLSAPLQTNLSTPLRRRSGGEPLNPGLPEHTPKKRRIKEAVLSTEGQQFDPNLGTRLEQAVDDRHRQAMSEQAPLKEWIEDRSAKGAANEKCAKGSGNTDNAHSAAPAMVDPLVDEGVKDHSQESSNASISAKNACAMTDLMWKEHPSSQAGFALSSAEQQRLDAYTLLWKEHHSKQTPKSAKTVFFEENAKGLSPKWGDQDDEEFPIAPLWNYGALNEENASSSAVVPAEKSKDGPLSGNEEKAPSADESQPLSDIGRHLISRMKPGTAEKFKAFLADKLQERQHALVPLAPGSPSLVLPSVSPGNIAEKEDMQVAEDEVMQVDSQANGLTIPPHLAEQIDEIQEEEVKPKRLLLHELHSRHLRGELNSIDDVRITFEAVMGEDFSGKPCMSLRQHTLVPSAPNSPSREKPPASPREIVEDEVMQVDSQGNSLTIPPHLADVVN